MSQAQKHEASWKELDMGGVTKAGTAAEFRTGDWRSSKPNWIVEKCKQCLLCYPVCPDTSILIDSDGKRTEFNFDHCKGCGVCAAVCPFGAIDMLDEEGGN